MTDPTIHVSFPQPPDACPKTLHWHAQLSRHVVEALQGRFDARVRFSLGTHRWNQVGGTCWCPSCRIRH
jgi:hypothetical protein